MEFCTEPFIFLHRGKLFQYICVIRLDSLFIYQSLPSFQQHFYYLSGLKCLLLSQRSALSIKTQLTSFPYKFLYYDHTKRDIIFSSNKNRLFNTVSTEYIDLQRNNNGTLSSGEDVYIELFQTRTGVSQRGNESPNLFHPFLPNSQRINKHMDIYIYVGLEQLQSQISQRSLQLVANVC